MAAPRPQPLELEPQSTNTVVMVRPAAFASNPETRATNAFQVATAAHRDLSESARAEFDSLVETLRRSGVIAHVLDDELRPPKPDAVFPNNWFSTHADGTVVLYPMHAPSRRLERRPDLLEQLRRVGFRISRTLDLSGEESAARYLEGTGSLVLDRAHRVAYACRSPRTSTELLARWARELGYSSAEFTAVDAAGRACYHTNVMMCIGTGWAAVCFAAIRDRQEREAVRSRLIADGHELVELQLDQVARFAGNLLELSIAGGRRIIALSESAHDALTVVQRAVLERHATLVVSPIPTIEAAGGGSVRCMISEIFLPHIGATDA